MRLQRRKRAEPGEVLPGCPDHPGRRNEAATVLFSTAALAAMGLAIGLTLTGGLVRRTRAVVAATAVGLITHAICGATLAQANEQAVSLAGTTTIVAPAYPARTVVTVPKTLQFGDQGYLDLPYVTINGTASVAAIFLIPVGTRSRTDEVNMFGRLPRSLGGTHTIASFPDGVETLVAGQYQLLMLHSPGTASITIRLPGLKGRATVTPRSPSKASMALLSPARAISGGYAPTGTSGIVDRMLAARGFITINAGVLLPIGGVSHTEVCMYEGGGDLPSILNLLPGCSDGNSIGSTAVQGTLSYAGSSFLNWDPGKYGASVDYQTTALPTGVAGWAAWVPYDG